MLNQSQQKVKIRFLPINEASRDLVVSCGHKQVLDVTLKVKKSWKSIIDHIISKWSSIENIDKRLQLFLFKEGEIYTTTNFNDSFFFEESVEVVLMRDATFRSFIINPLPRSIDALPLVHFSYSILNPAPGESVALSSEGNVMNNENSLLPGYTVMEDSWMHAFSLMSNPAQYNGAQSKPSMNSNPISDSILKSIKVPASDKSDGQAFISGINNVTDPECFSFLKRHDMSLTGFSASVMGRFSSTASNILPHNAHSLMGGILSGNSASVATNSKGESLSANAKSRIFHNVEKAILSSSPNAVPKTLATENNSISTSQPSPNSSNLSLQSSGGGSTGGGEEEGSNMSVNMLQVRYKKKKPRIDSDVPITATNISTNNIKQNKSKEGDSLVSERPSSEKLISTEVTNAATIAAEQQDNKNETAPTVSSPVPTKHNVDMSSSHLLTPEKSMLKVDHNNNNSLSFLSPGSERKRKRVRFEEDKPAPSATSSLTLNNNESPSKLSPVAKATARSVSKGHAYIDSSQKGMIQSLFMPSLSRVGRSRPELKRIKPTFIRPLTSTDE